MWIQMQTSVVCNDLSVYDEGQAYDLSTERAKELVRLGKAEVISDSRLRRKAGRSDSDS